MIGQHCLHLAVTINTGEQLVRGAVFSNAGFHYWVSAYSCEQLIEHSYVEEYEAPTNAALLYVQLGDC